MTWDLLRGTHSIKRESLMFQLEIRSGWAWFSYLSTAIREGRCINQILIKLSIIRCVRFRCNLSPFYLRNLQWPRGTAGYWYTDPYISKGKWVGIKLLTWSPRHTIGVKFFSIILSLIHWEGWRYIICAIRSAVLVGHISKFIFFLIYLYLNNLMRKDYFPKFLIFIR